MVNISSVHGLRASPFKAAYVAAKHRLEGLSKVVALEGADLPDRVLVAVCRGDASAVAHELAGTGRASESTR